MGNFFTENWIWIFGPLVLVVLGVSALVLFGATGEDNTFIYNL